jgi:hypothetical protein
MAPAFDPVALRKLPPHQIKFTQTNSSEAATRMVAQQLVVPTWMPSAASTAITL